jgi:hypothetical protein
MVTCQFALLSPETWHTNFYLPDRNRINFTLLLEPI